MGAGVASSSGGASGTTGWGKPNAVAVPVHNVPALLGAEQTERVVRESWPLFGGGVEEAQRGDEGGGGADDGGGFIYMLAGRRTVDLQADLWKLQGYLASYTE